MAGAKKGSWIGATVFGSLVIVVASWFLAINPTLSAASDVRAQTAQVKSQNDALALKVAKLKADFAKLDDYKKQLGEVRKQIPSTAQLSDYLRQLDTIAATHTVTVTTVTPGTPTAVVAKTPAVPAAQPTPAATGSATPAPASPADGSSAGGAATGTTTGAAASGIPAGFTSIPMSVTVLGSYDNTLAFLSDLQTATPRLFLVSGFTGTGQQDAAASGGKPKTSVGDQELVVTGFLFVLPDTAVAATPTPTPTPTATPALPGAVPGKNPLDPVGGK